MSEMTEVLEKLHAVALQLAVTNTKLDNVTTQLNNHAVRDDKTFTEHGKRINTLEKRAWYQSGAAAVLGVVGATLYKKFMG